jgi:hypothetical protein
MNKQIARMTKGMEDLVEQNVALLARISKQSHTITIVCNGIL